MALYGFYSEQQRQSFVRDAKQLQFDRERPSQQLKVYSTPDGGERICTQVASSPEYTDGWDDLTCLGEVVVWLRNIPA
jgi:hypothetical protein